MLRSSFYRAVVVASVLASLTAQPAGAVTNYAAHTVPYVVAYERTVRGGIPYSGQMTLTYNSGGIITGRYTDTSIRPGGPLANARNVWISGGITHNDIHFTIGQRFSVRGTIANGTITATAIVRGVFYDFKAKRGTPGHPG
jgi:hypothetical protein